MKLEDHELDALAVALAVRINTTAVLDWVTLDATGLPRRWLKRQIAEGVLEAKRVGRLLVVRRQDLNALIASLPPTRSKPASTDDQLEELFERNKLRPIQGGRR